MERFAKLLIISFILWGRFCVWLVCIRKGLPLYTLILLVNNIQDSDFRPHVRRGVGRRKKYQPLSINHSYVHTSHLQYMKQLSPTLCAQKGSSIGSSAESCPCAALHYLIFKNACSMFTWLTPYSKWNDAD